MPGRLHFLTPKLRSQSVPNNLDIKKPLTLVNSYQPVYEEPNMNQTETDGSWFKTWPERSYDKLEQSNDSSPSEESPSSPTSMKISEPGKTSMSLNALLENIPLAYSPITKQLHLIKNEADSGSLVSPRKGICPSSVHNLETDKPKIDSEEGSNIHRTDEVDHKPWGDSKGADEVDHKPWGDEKVKRVDEWSEVTTEVSSFSSIVSSLSDSSPNISTKLSVFDDEISQCSHDSVSMCGESSKFFNQDKSEKRKGLTAFFSRNVFSWKSNVSHSPSLAPGWKLFGKTNSIDASSNLSLDSSSKGSQQSISDGKKYEDVVASSSALILHNRPANLPAKSQDEEHKHRLEYQQMVEAAKKKELKENKEKKRQLQQQLKQEEQLATSARVWNNEILPKWETMKNCRKCRELWWQGLPPCVRGKVWKLAIVNELNITYQLYDICVSRAQERLKTGESSPPTVDTVDNPNKESSVELIQLDISRTFPHLCIFQKGGPYYDILHSLLGAYVCYRPDVGYVQGMSFIAAILILNLEAADAFICFANLLNRPCHMAFFSLNEQLMNAYYNTYNDLFRENLPKLHEHFQQATLTPDLYLLDWVYTVFAKAMPLDIACHIWDVFLRDGEEFLIRAALGILHHHQDKLISLDFITGAQFLTKLPEDLASDKLFKSIDIIRMNIGKLSFNEILAVHVDR